MRGSFNDRLTLQNLRSEISRLLSPLLRLDDKRFLLQQSAIILISLHCNTLSRLQHCNIAIVRYHPDCITITLFCCIVYGALCCALIDLNWCSLHICIFQFAFEFAHAFANLSKICQIFGSYYHCVNVCKFCEC